MIRHEEPPATLVSVALVVQYKPKMVAINRLIKDLPCQSDWSVICFIFRELKIELADVL